MKLTFAFCTYNRAGRLNDLVASIRAQQCPIPFDILAVNNNSPDNTAQTLTLLAEQPGPTLRWVTETEQGIVPARNRALDEALGSDILVFIDDDEIPQPGLLNAVCDAIINEQAQCVGGRVEVDFGIHGRPAWLEDDLLGFLAETDYGPDPFWITDETTPIWTSNIAYDTRLFKSDPNLRFDKRYNRQGADVGGGEDAMMFRALLSRDTKIRYRPDMEVIHFVEPWRLTRRYFLQLHYRAGLRHGKLQMPSYNNTVLDMPPFLISQFLTQSMRTISTWIRRQPGHIRQAMNAAYALGILNGYRSRQ